MKDGQKEEWQLREAHENEVKEILKREGCMSARGHLRAFKRSADEALERAGHTSLSFFECRCRFVGRSW